MNASEFFGCIMSPPRAPFHTIVGDRSKQRHRQRRPQRSSLQLTAQNKCRTWKHLYIFAFSHKLTFMRTTLDLPDPLFKEVKTRAVQLGVKLKDLLAAYIEAGLRAPQTQESATALRQNPHPLPVAWERVPGEPLTPYRTNADLYAILDEEDIENFHRVFSPSQPKP
jgi:hypothetical protein